MICVQLVSDLYSCDTYYTTHTDSGHSDIQYTQLRSNSLENTHFMTPHHFSEGETYKIYKKKYYYVTDKNSDKLNYLSMLLLKCKS